VRSSERRQGEGKGEGKGEGEGKVGKSEEVRPKYTRRDGIEAQGQCKYLCEQITTKATFATFKINKDVRSTCLLSQPQPPSSPPPFN
jgi:hypothetical protein